MNQYPMYQCDWCGKLQNHQVGEQIFGEDEEMKIVCPQCGEKVSGICSDCGDLCESVEETFDYSGTHCNHGIAGTHHTGHYVSKCCLAEIES